MKFFFKSILKSIIEALGNNEYISRWCKKNQRTFGFIANRLSFIKPYGFYFSFGVALSALAFFYFVSLIQDVVAKDPFVSADIRIMNLIAAFRSLTIAKIFLLFTYLGNWQVVISISVIMAMVLILLRNYRKLLFVTITIAGGELIYSIFKLLLHRTRPDIGFSLIPRSGYSFPSGHAAISIFLYGLIGYLIFKVSKKWWQKSVTILISILLFFLIGFSRMYLGVHWASDILAGWFLGFSWLALMITIFEQRERFKPAIKNKTVISSKLIISITVLLIIVEGIFFFYFYQEHPLSEPSPANFKKISISQSTNLQSIISYENFPKFSETLVGAKMEPISFIIIGSKNQIIETFQKSGWFIANDPNRIKNLYRLAVAAFLNKPYPAAPVTPSFLNAQPHTIAFEKPTGTNTVRQRHHTRFWLTNFYWGEIPIWVATASFDNGLYYFITHKISPDIDTERDFINDELLKTGAIEVEKQIQLIESMIGQNQSGDKFFTDGRAYIILLK